MHARMILGAALLLPLLAVAQTGVTGLWKTIDDQTGKPKSLVRITEVNGEYQGKIDVRGYVGVPAEEDADLGKGRGDYGEEMIAAGSSRITF